MELTIVESSMIYAVGYDPKTETLHVIFTRTGVYCYEGVPKKIYDDLMASDSIGSYMRLFVIDQYPYYRP